jgi:hypothetical protein
MHHFAALVASLIVAMPARAAAPRDDLLRLVPPDVAFCLVVENLRDHAAAFLRSPFYEQFRRSPLGAALLASPEAQKLAEVERVLRHQLQIDFQQIRDDLLGDAVVFAYRPGPPGQPEREQGLILLHARDPNLLARFLARFDDAQKQSGDVQDIQECAYQGVTYERRVETKATTYRYRRGPVLILTGQEALLRQAIDLDRADSPDEAPLVRRFRQLGDDGRLAGLWLNPRAFEPELRQKAAAAQGPEATFLRHLLTYWQALDGVGLTLTPERDLRLSLTLRGKAEGLPPAARRLFAGSGRSPEVWARFPPDALLAVAGRVDLPALLDVLAGFLDESARPGLRAVLGNVIGPVLGQEMIEGILPNVGPDCGLCVVAPPTGGRDWFPHVLGVVRVRPGDGAIAADVGLTGALQAFAMFVVREHNRQHGDRLRLRAVAQDGVEVKYLVNDERFPPGFRPAFALKDGYLVLASSPAAVRRFGPARPAAEAPLLRLSVRALRQYLADWRAPLVSSSAAKNQLTEHEAGRQLDQLLAALAWFDRLEVSPRSTAGEITLTLRAVTSRPLK